MRPKRSELSLVSGIPTLFVMKGTQRSVERVENWQNCPSSVFCLGKGSISLGSVLHFVFSSASHSLLFHLQAAILDRLVPLETEWDPATAVWTFSETFQVQANRSFLLVCSMLCTGQRHSWVILLSCGSQQNRGLQVSNDPLNASQIVNAPVPLFSLPLPSSFLLN